MVDPDILSKVIASIPLKEGFIPEKLGETDPAVAAIIAGMDLTPKPELTQLRLKEVLDYDPTSGIFRWKIRGRGVQQAGSIAGYVRLNKRYNARYVFIKINNRAYAGHVLAWLYVYGKFPKKSIDHIDRDSTNNRIANLIEADGSIQKYNSNLYNNNTSGHRGVYWNSNQSKWSAMIGNNGALLFLGYFNTIEAAVAARQAAEIQVLGCLTEELKDVRNRRPSKLRRL